jgi:chromosome segregation ATPase
MSEERLEQVEQKLDSLISAIQSGFGSFERQLNDLHSGDRQISTDMQQLSTDMQQLSSQVKKVEERVQIIDSRINTIDLRLAGISSDILGLQTEQNRIKEYLFNRPR